MTSGPSISTEDGVGEAIFKRGMREGMLVRIIRQPRFGVMGKISALPVELQEIRTESAVRVLEVALEAGRKVIVPRVNVEIIAK